MALPHRIIQMDICDSPTVCPSQGIESYGVAPSNRIKSYYAPPRGSSLSLTPQDFQSSEGIDGHTAGSFKYYLRACSYLYRENLWEMCVIERHYSKAITVMVLIYCIARMYGKIGSYFAVLSYKITGSPV